MCKLFSILIKQLKLYLILKIKLIVNSPNFLLYLTIGVLVDLMLGSLVVESPEFQESWQFFKKHYPENKWRKFLYEKKNVTSVGKGTIIRINSICFITHNDTFAKLKA